MRLYIITPTIGRESLKRCIQSVKNQIIYTADHIVIGDGPQDEWVKKYCSENTVHYYELNEKGGHFGTKARNFALDKILSFSNNSEYIMFLDDDNELLINCIYNIFQIISENKYPPFIYQPILFTGKFNTYYEILPKDESNIPSNGDWDNLNGIFRADLLNDIRFKTDYNHDYLFMEDFKKKVKDFSCLKVKGINAIHHVSWDTYDEVYK